MLRLIKGEEARFTNFVFMETPGIRLGQYGTIHVAEAVKKNHDLPIRVRIDETQENSTAFEEMRVSKWVKVRSDIYCPNWSRTLRRYPRGDEKIELIARSR